MNRWKIMAELGMLLVIITIVLSVRASSWARRNYPRVRLIQIEDNRAFTTRQILEWMFTRQGEVFQEGLLEQDLEAILKHYQEAGYLLAEVGVTELSFPEDSSWVNIRLKVSEGPLLRVGRVSINGNKFLDTESILSQFDTRPGKPFREQTLEQDVDNLLTVYEDNGYPYCKVFLSDFQVMDEGSLHFSLQVKEGPLVVIKGVKVEGNEITKDHVIIRELGIAPGDLYRQREIDRGWRRLERLGLFERVYPPKIECRGREDRATLVVGVEEGKMNAVSGLLGYLPTTEEGKGYFTGLIDLCFRNLFGTTRRLEAHWSRAGPYSSRLRFAYREPWILRTPVDLGLELEQVDQDTSYTLTSLGATLYLPLSDYLNGHLGLGWERVIPDPRPGLALARSRKFTGALGLELDIRDDRFNPRRGIFYRTTAEYGIKHNWPTAFHTPSRRGIESTRFTLDLEHFIPTLRGQVLAMGLHGGQIRSQEEVVPLSEQFRLGGATTLRGYREEQFTGSRVAWANWEYRFLLAGRSRAFLFVDLGYYSHRVQNLSTGTVETRSGKKVGYGLGLRLESRLGMIGLDYGLGWGDSPLEGKLHFRMQNEF